MNHTNEIWVYADWYMYDTPRPVGILSFFFLRGKTVYSFEYSNEWLKTGIAIDPEIPLYPGLHYAPANENFGIFKDSSPDRWGQLLMKRREVLLAKLEKRKPFPLYETDFLLGVHDSHRMGGARPKADVVDARGRQWIAKFPGRSDDYDVGLWEMIVHELAVKAKINVPNASLKKLGTSSHTYLSQRFDRTEDHKRIHYASAMTLLQHDDGDDAATGAGYLELAAFIKSECADAKPNLEELFRRVLFSVCVSNTDDHLRNHGFIYTDAGWTLSPAFDINANETGTGLKLNIDEQDNSLDLDLVMKTASAYLLSGRRAGEIKTEVTAAVAAWRTVAIKYKAPASEMERKAGAFKCATNVAGGR
jgi:serine/threonine-protein kinase HipA